MDLGRKVRVFTICYSAKDEKLDLRLFPNVSHLGYQSVLKSPSFHYLLQGKRQEVRPQTFSKRLLSRLSIYLEKSKFSLFIIGQKTKSRTSDFSQTFLV